MFDFTFEEWYWLCSVALIMGTIWHLYDLRLKQAKKVITHHEAKLAAAKKCAATKKAKLSHLQTEAVRTRLMLDAWLLRNPRATLSHPGAKVVLIHHMNALHAYHEAEGTFTYAYPGETIRHYDSPYWRAVWHVYHHGRVRSLPSCPLESF